MTKIHLLFYVRMTNDDRNYPVTLQVREINAKVSKAAQEVDVRLAAAQSGADKSKFRRQEAKNEYESWEIGWAEENEHEPSVQDV